MNTRIEERSLFSGARILALAFAIGATGCNSPEAPEAKYTLEFPNEDTIVFESTVLSRAGFSLDGAIDLPPYAQLYFEPETAQSNFTFGLRIDTKSFLPEEWQGFGKVNRLPTGAFFPSWIKTDLIAVPVDDRWTAYFGLEGEKYVGATYAFADDEKDPKLGLSYNFRDKDGNVVLGVLFYGPKRVEGTVAVPGGVFVGTNLSQFIKKTATSDARIELSDKILENGLRGMNRKTRKSDIQVIGKNAWMHQSSYGIKKLTKRYMRALRRANRK